MQANRSLDSHTGREGLSTIMKTLIATLWLLLLLPNCRSASGVGPDGANASGEATRPAEHSSAHEGHDARANRDPHGDPDVERYVARLSSAERVAELRVDEVVAHLALPENAIVGDLGCGPGVFAIPLARAVREGFVLASDVEPAQLDALSAALTAQNVRNVLPVLASPADPHFPPGRVDLVFVGDTYHHLRDRVAYFRRLRDALTPGGRLAILEYRPGPLPVGPPPEHKLAAGVREAELTEAGYVLVEQFDTHAYHDFEIWRARHPWEK